MSDQQPTVGSTFLVHRLLQCPGDRESWRAFVQRFWPVIYEWSRKKGLQDADAQDVTQVVFTGLLDGLRSFDRTKGAFRPWLSRVVRNRVIDWCQSPAHRDTERGTEKARQRLAEEESRVELDARLNDEFDRELVEVAETRTRLRLKKAITWDAYRLVKQEGLSLADAAMKLKIPIGHVSKYTNRVLEMIRGEIRCLTQDLEDEVRDSPSGG